MSHTVIQVENISKKFTLDKRSKKGAKKAGSFERILNDDMIHSDFWALKDVTFDVKFGQSVAIIGKNGSGKSTLLKILSRVLRPTTGKFKIKGRLISLLEVGTGFHAELSGRENVYLNGSILGMSKADIDRRFDEIVDFSGIEDFIDMPVKRYSSGMYVRLAFSVAAHLDPEVFIVDEVLSVGDSEFQQSCQEKLKEISYNDGKTVLFVGHKMSAMRNLTQRGMILQKGNMIYDGHINDALDFYLYGNQITDKRNKVIIPPVDSADAQITSLAILDEDNQPKNVFDMFDDIFVEIGYHVKVPNLNLRISLTIERNGTVMFKTYDTDFDLESGKSRTPGKYITRVKLLSPLKAGYYTIRLVGIEDYHDNTVHKESYLTGFEVVQDDQKVKTLHSYHKVRWGEIPAILNWKTKTEELISC